MNIEKRQSEQLYNDKIKYLSYMIQSLEGNVIRMKGRNQTYPKLMVIQLSVHNTHHYFHNFY